MTNPVKKNITVSLKVHPIVYDFYYAQYGDSFELKADSVLSIILPHVLSLKPRDYCPQYKTQNYKPLKVVIRDMMIGSASDVVQFIHAQDRHYISDRNQYYISRFLDNIVKNIFHNYMIAYMRAAPQGTQQKQGIVDFCQVYRIQNSRLNYEMLKKSWDRSGEKKEWQRMEKEKNKNK